MAAKEEVGAMLFLLVPLAPTVTVSVAPKGNVNQFDSQATTTAPVCV